MLAFFDNSALAPSRADNSDPPISQNPAKLADWPISRALNGYCERDLSVAKKPRPH
jgi:hypothetical protein